ncbi:MAG: TSUP family transporter, partial [Devosia sp.]
MLDPLILLALAGVGLLAGFVDAVAGGGGLIGIPALLFVGLPPVSALATNKVQGACGTAMAVVTYWRRGFIDIRALALAAGLTLCGSVIGALIVKRLDISIL